MVEISNPNLAHQTVPCCLMSEVLVWAKGISRRARSKNVLSFRRNKFYLRRGFCTPKRGILNTKTGGVTMWLWYALGSAVLSGSTAILAKYSTKKVDSSAAVAIRSAIILLFAWLVVVVGNGWQDIGKIDLTTVIIPIISGVTSALAWLCYFKALQGGTVGQVASIDKTSMVLTMLGGWLFLNEAMTAQKLISIVLVSTGALLMYEPRKEKGSREFQTRKVCLYSHWLLWAIASAVFTAGTTLLSKAGTAKLSSDLGFAIRTGVMFIITWGILIIGNKTDKLAKIDRRSMLFVCISGLSTALAWLCYFRALASPSAQAGIVQPTDKLSILVSVTGARILFKEKLSRKSKVGLFLLVSGILILIFL